MHLCNSLKAQQYGDAAAAMLNALQLAGREGQQPQPGGSLPSAEEPVQPRWGQQWRQQPPSPGQPQGLPQDLGHSSRLPLQTLPPERQQQQQAAVPQQRPMQQQPPVVPQSRVWHWSQRQQQQQPALPPQEPEHARRLPLEVEWMWPPRPHWHWQQQQALALRWPPQQQPLPQQPLASPQVPMQHWGQQQQEQQPLPQPKRVQVPEQGWQAQQAQRRWRQVEEGVRPPGSPIIVKQESEEVQPKEEPPQVHAPVQPQPRQQHGLIQLLEAALLHGAAAAPLNERMVATFVKLLPLEQPKVSLAYFSSLGGRSSHSCIAQRGGEQAGVNSVTR